MADVKISGMTAKGAALATTDLVEISEGGTTTKSATGANIAAMLTGNNNTFSKAQRGSVTGLTDGVTITPDFADNNYFSVTLGGNRTLANPSNLVAGQSGSIFVTQDGTGTRTLSFGTYWKFAGGTAPDLTATASAVDRIDYVVKSTTEIHAVWSGDVQ